MRKTLCIVVALASLTTICTAQTITQNFGTGANSFSMDFVRIGEAGNAPTVMGSVQWGAVGYVFNLGKYEVSREMIEKANASAGLSITLNDMSRWGGNGANTPATGVSWYEAASFVNYLNTSTGFNLAYKFNSSGVFERWSPTDLGYNSNNLLRNSMAKFYLPSVDEWFKGAYGSPSGTWFNYATGSDSTPTAVSGGTDPNTIVFGGQASPAEITNAGGLSAYGTMAQGGNVWEWIENENPNNGNYIQGGGFRDGIGIISSTMNFSEASPVSESNYWGFRVASVPEPSSFSLLALGGVVVALRRRKK